MKTILSISNALPPTVLKITGTERTHARNQRKKTATRHLDLERNPTSLKGCTTTMYLVKDENYNVFITFLEVSHARLLPLYYNVFKLKVFTSPSSLQPD